VARTVTQFLVCNSVHAEAPPPPPGVERTHSACADCGRDITWIVAVASSKSHLPHVCGGCALNRMRALPNNWEPLELLGLGRSLVKRQLASL
jgi:hypothetical protein